MTDRYILASELPGVAEAWGVWVGCCAEEPCHCDAQTLPEELDVTIPADAAFLCLTWGPRVDRRCGESAQGRLDTSRHWLSLLNNPAALAAECRAVMEDKTNA